jgi:hypothetical protein
MAEESQTSGTSSPAKEEGSSDDIRKSQRSSVSAFLQHARTEISIEYADLPIIACCLVSGLCDSSAYNSWSCFVSMQTGKTFPNLSLFFPLPAFMYYSVTRRFSSAPPWQASGVLTWGARV